MKSKVSRKPWLALLVMQAAVVIIGGTCRLLWSPPRLFE